MIFAFHNSDRDVRPATFSPIRKWLVLFIAIWLVMGLVSSSFCGANPSQFPLYPVIRKNVSFWEKIYSTYSVNTAVLHDKKNLGIVYATVSLRKPTSANAEKYNKKKLKAAKKKYSDILLKLAKGKSARFGQMRKVKKLFPAGTRPEVFREAAKNVRVQHGLKERFKDGVIRSGAYMAEIKTIFQTYGLPRDLAYLPHVESSFNLKAHSKHGAAGIWQFTRSTGKQYMQIDDAIDERRDPIIAAHAAAKFLQDNYQTLQNWPMAITAYNYGKAGMMRAKKAKTTYEHIFTSYQEGHFKFASRNFYAEFLAAVYVAKKLEKSKTLKLDKPAKTISVRMPQYGIASKISRYLNISPDTIKKHNPALLTSVFKGEKYIPKHYYLRLPSNRVKSNSFKNMPHSLFASSQKQSRKYTVKRGDTASTIALRHKVSLNQLIKLNNLKKDGHVYIGQTLKIPQSVKASSSTKTKGIKTIRATQKKTIFRAKAQSPMAAPSQLNVGNLHSKQGVIHGEIITQPGETYSLLAKWLKISETQLKSINQINNSTKLYPGQKILVRFSATNRIEFERRRKQFH